MISPTKSCIILLMDQLFFILDSVAKVLLVLFDYWWIWLPVLLFVTLWEEIERYNRAKYLVTLKWVLIEIRVPQEAHKSLKAMEQVFAAFHALPQPPPPKNIIEAYRAWKARFVEGKVPDWLSLEIIGMSGEIHFYVRTVEAYRNLVEAQIYAHYPDAELSQVADHVAQLPMALPSNEFESTGIELALTKEDVYPIKTYPEFEEQGAGKDDVRRIDPLAPVAETLSSLQFGEYLGMQILVRPTGDGWVKKGQPVMDKLYGKPVKTPESAFEKYFINPVDSVLGGGGPPAKEEKKEPPPFNQLAPGVQELIKTMERSFVKLAFETGIRILYAAPRDRFDRSRIWALMATFKQYSTQSWNGFKPGFMTDVIRGRNKEMRSYNNKVVLYERFRSRAFPTNPFVLTTEELTTIYHFPDIGVRTPALPRVEAKKGEAPAGLPII